MLENESLQILLKVWPFLYAVLALLFGWLAWSLNKKFMPRSEHEQQQEVVSTRLDSLERKQEHSATKEDIHRLEKQVLEVKGDIKSIGSDLSRLTEAMTRQAKFTDMIIQNHLPPGGSA